MTFHYVPLLQIQREIQGLPLGRERFRTYLRTMLNADGTDIELVPLLPMNPMAKPHVTELLDQLLALDPDRVATEALSDASARLEAEPGDFRAGLVVVDDLKGG